MRIVFTDDVCRRHNKQDDRMPEVTPNATAPSNKPGYVLVLLTLLSAVAFMDRQILAVLIEPVKREFDLTDLQIGLITGLGFSLTFALTGIPLGRVADHGVRRNVLAWSRGLGGLLGAAGAMAGGFWTLLFSRAGGAISEAGGGPASISMLSDLFPAAHRSRVISVLGAGASLGALLSLWVGGWLVQHHGWRATIATVGLSALALSLLLRWTVHEPMRAHVSSAAPPVQPRGALRDLWQSRATRWLIVGAAFALMAGYGFGAWNNTLLIRHHHLSLQHAGWISGAAALASIFGAIGSGMMTDRLVRRDARWQLGVPLLGLMGALPCGMAYLMLPSGAVVAATALMVVYAFLIVWWAAPVYAAMSFLVPAQQRATAHAVMMLVGSIVGNGLGPILTGWLSDVLNQPFPGQGLRYALMLMVMMLLPAMYAFTQVRRLYRRAHAAHKL